MSAHDADASHSTLLIHLDQVYAMARVLAPTAQRAAKLVEATYRRAHSTPRPPRLQAGPWLLRLLLQTYATRRSDAATTSSVSTMHRPADLLQDVRRKTAEAALRRAVPVAFALQTARQQLVLTLADITDLSPDDAAVVLDTEPQAFTKEVTAARRTLWKAIRTELTDGARTLVEEELPDDAVTTALRRTIAPELGTPPPTLRPAVAAILEQPPELDPEDEPAGDLSALDAPDLHDAASSSHRLRTTRPHLGERVQRWGLAALLLLVVGLGGYLLSNTLQSDAQRQPTSLLQLSVRQADTIEPRLFTNSPAEAEQFVRQQLGRYLTVPRIDSAALAGVSIVELPGGVSVPAFLFTDTPSNERITAYAYTYALLDRMDGNVQLTVEMREQLQQESTVSLQRLDERGVLVWRQRDDIFVAVTRANPEQVRARITPTAQRPRPTPSTPPLPTDR